MIIQVLGAFVAVLGFSTVMEVPKKLLIHTSVIGAAGWLVYLLMSRYGYTPVMSSFGSASIITY